LGFPRLKTPEILRSSFERAHIANYPVLTQVVDFIRT